MKATLKLAFTLVLALIALTFAQDYSYEAATREDVPFEATPIEGVESAAVIGDSSQAELYVMVGRLAEGVVFPVHTHPDARLSTVLSGTMYYGVGETFEEIELTPYPTGSVVYTSPGTPHWMWAQDGEVVVQESGFGPTESVFLESAD